MLLQDVKEIKNGRIISGQRELTLDSKTKDSQEDTINKLKGFGYEINGKLAGGSVNMTKKSKSSGGAFNVIVNSEGLVNGYPLESVMYLVQNVGDSKTKDKGVFSPGQPVYWTYGWSIRNAVIVKKISSDRYDIKWNNGIFEVNVDDLFDDKEAAKKYIGDSKSTKDRLTDSEAKQQVFRLLEKWWNSPYGVGNEWGNKGTLLDRLKREIPGLTGSQASSFHREWASTKDSKTKDYDRCPCGKGYFEETGHDWLGEDKNGIGRTRIYEECTGCGKKKSYIITEGGKVVYDSKTKDSKSTKDQIAELESQKEEAKKMGYGTDAYDAKIKSLQKDAFSQPLTVEEIKSLFQNIDPMYAKMLSGVVTSKQMAVRKGLEVGLKLSSEGARFKDSVDSSDIFTQDPLTEKGKEILAAMKKQYGEEKGEQVFYASKNKGTISGVDSYDPTQPRNIAAAKKLSVAQGKAATGDAPAPKEFDYLKDWQNAAMERGYRLQNSLQRGMWVAYQGNREMGTFVRTRGGKLYLDSKTKDASRSEQAYDEGYEAALQGKSITANPYKDVSRSGYADLKESWEDGYRDCRSGKSSKDSKTKDDLEEEIKKMAREKADRPFNDDGTIRTPQQAQLAYEQWYKIIKSRYKNDSRYKDSKTKDFKAKRPGWYVVNNNDEPIEGPFNEIKCKQRAKELGMDYVYITDYDLHRSNDSDIIINVVENPNEEVESEEEAFDLVHYNGYNIKLVKETGEYDIYDVGGAMIGHTATLELAKLFVDNKGNATIVYE